MFKSYEDTHTDSHRQKGDLISLHLFLAYFPYFVKIKVGLCNHHAAYVSMYSSPNNF
jgi:hypothetical protein